MRQGFFGRAAFTAMLVLAAAPAQAHHPMGGRLPATFTEGLLSGLGHPIIGLDHLAAIVAVGCIAAAHRAGAVLAVAYVAAMIGGTLLHLQGASLPASEALVAISVLALGALIVSRAALPNAAVLVLGAAAGFVHGYVLGESIIGAERAPLWAYLLGLTLVQIALALSVMAVARLVLRPSVRVAEPVRLVGAGIAGIGIATLVQQLGSGVGGG
jgi:urease accessory protein